MNAELAELIEKYETGTFSSKSSELLFEGLMAVGTIRSLFKYSSASSGIRNLKESTLFFNSPVNFNDIRDCNPKMLNMTSDYLMPMARNAIVQLYPGKYSNKQINHLLKSPEVIRTIFPKIRNTGATKLIERVLITCFTLNNTHELMWAHYSKDHTGICIEYDSHNLLRYFNTLEKNPIFLKLQYMDEIKPVLVDGNDIPGSLISWLLKKSKNWSYEDEIRCAFLDKTGVDNPISIPKELVKGIYLGSKISSENRDIILSHLKKERLDAMVYNMELNDDLSLSANLIYT